jgi:hypothetical protein
VPKQKVIGIRALGDDSIPVRMTTERRSYDLVERRGDPS